MTRADSGQRSDIQALRALAVGAVIAYHLWPSALPGGFVGVDVFFVISGFLITSHLARELAETGRIRLGRFWARRARRLLPAAVLVLLVVTVATVTVAPLSVQPGFVRQVLSSALYGQNWALSSQAVDYLHANDAPSPVQHFWSLSVEEQFYVGLPLVMLAAFWVVRRRRAAVPAALALMAAGSLVYGIDLTRLQPGAAYFSTFGRAWEFLAGGLLALAPAILPRGLGARLLGVAGLAAVGLAMVRFSAGTPFPGSAAAVPVLGAVALIAAGAHSPLGLAARLRPVTWLGDVSYAAYLWHWPFVALVPYATGHALTTSEKVAILGVTLVIADLSTRFLEAPLRGLRSAPLRTGVAVATAMAVVGAVTVGTAQAADQHLSRLQAAGRELISTTSVRCLGADAELREASCALGDTLVPDPAVAGLDDHNSEACWARTDPTPHVCHRGSSAPGAFRVLAIGDSHNNMYLPWYEHLAARHGWSVDITGHSGCTWGTRPQLNIGELHTQQCTQWKANVARMLARHAPYDLIITTGMQSGGQVATRPGETPLEAGVDATRSAWLSQIRRGTTVVALRDTPRARPDVVSCVEMHREDANAACARSSAEVFRGPDLMLHATAVTPGSALIDPRDLLCHDGTCPPVIDHVVVYRDSSHLTQTFVRTMIPVLDRRLTKALRSA